MKLLLIDNYDSFTYNLYHDLGRLGAELSVVRNDKTSIKAIKEQNPDAIVLSPGPCTPDEAGICLELIDKLGNTIPMFGVCLGMQAIGQIYGGKVVRAPLPVHGKLSVISHHGQSVFRGINGSFKATRYHSLIVARETFPSCLTATAETADGLMMGLMHNDNPIHAVQFHPESISSEHGLTLLKNFLELAQEWNNGPRQQRQRLLSA
jgi:anthranilate synthase component 2